MRRSPVPDERLLPIYSVAFVGSLGFSIVLPFLVFVVTRLGGNALVYGAVGATYSLFQLVGAPVLGRWSDRHGRRRILLLSQVGTLLSWLVFLAALYLPTITLVEIDTTVTGAFTLTLPLVVLFVARALDGLTGGNVSVANAYLADVTAEGERSAAFGKMAVASNLGFVLGPAVAGILGGSALGETPPVLAAITVSIVATAIIFTKLPAVAPCRLTERPEREAVSGVLGQDHKDCYVVVHRPGPSPRALPNGRVRRLLEVHFLVFLAFNFFYISFPVHAATTLEWSLTQVGIFFSVMGLMMAVVEGPVLGFASRRFSERALVLAGSVILAGAFLLYSFPSVPVIYAATACLALGNGLMWPSILAMLADEAAPRSQGAVQGLASSSAAIASITGLLAGGVLYELIGERVFWVAAGITSASILVAITVRPRPVASSEVSPAALREALRRDSRSTG